MIPKLQNWIGYKLDDISNCSKKNFVQNFELFFNKSKISTFSLIEALIFNAEYIYNTTSSTQDVMFSGGIDSELIILTNKAVGIKQNVFTFRFENNHNIQDVENAKKICNDLDIPLHLIDFNLENFIENEADHYFKKTYFPFLGFLVRLPWSNYVDNLPVFGHGEPYWTRYDDNSTWYFNLFEGEFALSIWSNTIKRPIIGEWYLHTPDINYHFKQHTLVDLLLQNKIAGKKSSWSSRTEIFKEYFPTMYFKPKMTGYEGTSLIPGSKPKFYKEFQDYMDSEILKYKDIKYKVYNIPEENFDKLIF